MSNIYNIKDYFKQEVEISDEEKINLAKKNGYHTVEDYNYSIAKEFASNPSFSLSKEYYIQAQEYLKNVLISFLIYNKTNYIKEGKEITVYALNELITELYKGNEELIAILDKEGLSLKDFLKLVYTTTLEKVSENNLGLKREI